MRNVVVGLLLLLVAVSSVSAVDAQDQVDVAVSARVDEANRYLTAEVSRQITAEKEEILQEMKNYQDENFQIFDGRMSLLMQDTKNAVIIGSVGAAALANAIVGLALLIFMRKYSYEGYLKGLLEKQGNQILELHELNAKDVKRDLQGVMEMQAESRQQQVPTNTLGMQYGQVQAGRMSEMNQWQNIPAYQGSWVPPRENVQQQVMPNWQVPPSNFDPTIYPEQQYPQYDVQDVQMQDGGRVQ